jgi:hypothetical protein
MREFQGVKALPSDGITFPNLYREQQLEIIAASINALEAGWDGNSSRSPPLCDYAVYSKPTN